jgi:hypothetical protein
LSDGASAIPILRFRAGRLPCGVAARDIVGLRGAPFDPPALWLLLGVPRADANYQGGDWVLRVAHDDASAEITVQGPIEIANVSAGDVLRRPATLALPNDGLIFGFARCAQELVVLLDIPSLVELAT